MSWLKSVNKKSKCQHLRLSDADLHDLDSNHLGDIDHEHNTAKVRDTMHGGNVEVRAQAGASTSEIRGHGLL